MVPNRHRPAGPGNFEQRDPRFAANAPNSAPVRPQSPPPPFTLTPDQQAEVDHVLNDWEKKSGEIKTFKCDFDRLIYDPVFSTLTPGKPEAPVTMSKGEIKFVAPDKGLMHETTRQTWQLNQKTHEREQVTLPNGEYWICDGKSLFQVEEGKKTATETPIPKEMQGQAITQGPLPFVFGAKAAELKARYYIRLTTPETDKENVWLDIRPKFLRDAENFTKTEVILRTADMFPVGVQIYPTNNGEHEVYLLKQKTWDWRSWLKADTFSPPWGYKIIPNQVPNVGPPQAGGAASPADGQARRPAAQPSFRQ